MNEEGKKKWVAQVELNLLIGNLVMAKECMRPGLSGDLTATSEYLWRAWSVIKGKDLEKMDKEWEKAAKVFGELTAEYRVRAQEIGRSLNYDSLKFD